MCLHFWTILQPGHRFSLECLLKLLALHGSMVRKMDSRGGIHDFMARKADAILGFDEKSVGIDVLCF